MKYETNFFIKDPLKYLLGQLQDIDEWVEGEFGAYYSKIITIPLNNAKTSKL